jgi:putative nucleotidyltransferase with HDIG domain
MKIPSPKKIRYVSDPGSGLNPGPWVQHSIYTAQAAEAIAEPHPRLDADAAYVMGLLHDIGRREGVTHVRHVLDGYTFLLGKGYNNAARICITHMFPLADLRTVDGYLDCEDAEVAFLRDNLAKIEFDEYDRLIQLCDAVALPSGFCLIEKRIVDVGLRCGVSEYTVERWKVRLATQCEFEKAIGQSIYRVLPGVVENTFGYDLINDQ